MNPIRQKPSGFRLCARAQERLRPSHEEREGEWGEKGGRGQKKREREEGTCVREIKKSFTRSVFK